MHPNNQFTAFQNVTFVQLTTCVCFHAVERETDVTVTESLQVAAAASQTDEDVTAREQLYHDAVFEMIYQFLSHTIDIKSSKLIDKLVAKNILSPSDRKKTQEQKKTDAKVDSLMMMLREKSAAEFDSFLTTLSETGQQSVVDVVQHALHTFRQTGQNPLHYVYDTYGKTVLSNKTLSQGRKYDNKCDIANSAYFYILSCRLMATTMHIK